MHKNPKGLSRTEWSLMKICWEKKTASARDIYEESLAEKTREYQTVKTMLDRLALKGYLTRIKSGNIWLYSPAVKQSHAVSREIDTFASTVLDNRVAPFVAHFVEHERITGDEIRELKRLISEYEEREDD